MGCNCEGSVKGVSTSSMALKQSFRRFWPDQFPFPPVAPWLGASVNRAEAFALMQRHAGKFPGLEHGSFAAYASLVGAVLYSDSTEYAAERQSRKKKPPPIILPYPKDIPYDPGCVAQPCDRSDGTVGWMLCCPDDYGGMTCEEECYPDIMKV